MSIQQEMSERVWRLRDLRPTPPNYVGSIAVGLSTDAVLEQMRAFLAADQIFRYRIMHILTDGKFVRAILRQEKSNA